MKFISDRFRRQDTILLLIAVLSVLFYVLTANGGFALDDSWIHQVYGRNLALTGQWAFISGVPSAASTSPLFTVLLSLGYRLGIDYKLWTHGLGALALAITGMIGSRMGERLVPSQKYVGFLTGLALTLSWHLLWAAVSGMETMLFGMWTLVLVWLGWQEVDRNMPEKGERSPWQILISGLLFGGLAALATLTRPEGVALAGLIGLTMLVVRPQRNWTQFFTWAVGAGLAFVLVISPYLVLNLQLTGGLLPNTSAAKQAEYAGLLVYPYVERFTDMLTPLIAGAQIFLLPGIIYFAYQAVRRFSTERYVLFDLLPMVWAIGLIGLYAARLPTPYQHGRYVIPALPSLILIGVVGTAQLVKLGQRTVMGRVLTRTLAVSAGLAFLIFAFSIGVQQYRRDVTIIDEEMVTASKWIAENIPADQLLAVHDIGAVGYFAPRPVLDLAGLISPEIVPFMTQPDQLWNWLEANGARYLMGFPEHVPGHNDKDPRLCAVFSTPDRTSHSVGGSNMTVYKLAWDGNCTQQ